jgi:hypothetical protein
MTWAAFRPAGDRAPALAETRTGPAIFNPATGLETPLVTVLTVGRIERSETHQLMGARCVAIDDGFRCRSTHPTGYYELRAI